MFGNKQPGQSEKLKPKIAEKKDGPKYEKEQEKPSFFDGDEGELEKQRRAQEKKIQEELDKFSKE